MDLGFRWEGREREQESNDSSRRKRRRHDRRKKRRRRQRLDNLRPTPAGRRKGEERNRIQRRHRRRSRLCPGPTRLLEKCSWPQCNPTCPKLLNPATGEELELPSLLQSFGLDMRTMAAALGIDLMTLTNMDSTQLLQILTQHS